MSQILEEVLSANAAYTAEAGGWRNPDGGPGSDAGEFISWLTISQPHDAVVSDVRRIRSHPLVPPAIPIHDYLFDVKTGALVKVPEATRIGAAANSRE